MAKVFLSYSSRDKDDVRRLAKDLTDVGVDVWLDEWEILVGDRITQKIQEGLADSDYLAVWLTRHAVDSGWVKREWQTKYYEEASNGAVSVLPLLAEACEIPLLLKDKKYADFTGDYVVAINELLKVITSNNINDEATQRHIASPSQNRRLRWIIFLCLGLIGILVAVPFVNSWLSGNDRYSKLPPRDSLAEGPPSGMKTESFESLGDQLLTEGFEFPSGLILSKDGPPKGGSFGLHIVDCSDGGGFFGVTCEDIYTLFPDGIAAVGKPNWSVVEFTLPLVASHVEGRVLETVYEGTAMILRAYDENGAKLDEKTLAGAPHKTWPQNRLSVTAKGIKRVEFFSFGTSTFLLDTLVWKE